MQPILNDPATRQRYSRYYYQLHKNVDEQMMIVFQALLNSRFRDNTFVIFTSDAGGGPKVWKYSRYFDNPQFWSTPGTPGDPNVDVEDVILEQKEPTPSTDGTSPIACQITVKHTPKPDEFEMYNVSDDPMELNNLYNAQSPSPEQITLAQLLEQQCAQKRLRPISGQVPGQPTCAP
jgi:choline-sulfatase